LIASIDKKTEKVFSSIGFATTTKKYQAYEVAPSFAWPKKHALGYC
jgi:hypothetical protein